MKELRTPITNDDIKELKVGELVLLSGRIFCGRDAVLPRIVELAGKDGLDKIGLDMRGSVIFHTAVSPAGVGPTSSNKLEIEHSMEPLSKHTGIKIHLGKGKIGADTVDALKRNDAVFAVIPPVTALLNSKTSDIKCAAFPELGMEALYSVNIDKYPVIIAAAQGESIYD